MEHVLVRLDRRPETAQRPARVIVRCDLEPNVYLMWTLRASAIVTPVAFLLSWHFGALSAQLLARLSELHREIAVTGGDSRTYLAAFEVSLRDAAAAALVWTRMFNVSIGAFGGSLIYALCRRQGELTWATGLRGTVARLRWLWRRHRLLTLRHIEPMSSRLLLYALLLAVFAVGVGALALRLGAGSERWSVQMFMGAAAILVVAATIAAGRATSVASRVPPRWSFIDSARFLAAAALFGVLLVISLGVAMAAVVAGTMLVGSI